MSNRYTSTRPTPVGGVIEGLLEDLLDHPRARAHRLWPLWRRAVGPELAAHTEMVRLHRGTLTVRVDSPVWASQLLYLKPDILERLRQHPQGEQLRELSFQQGSLRNRPDTPRRMPPPLPASRPDELEQAEKLVSGVTDPELRAALSRLVRTFLAARRLEQR